MKKEKTKKRAIEDILEDILRQLKFNHSQPIYPQEPHPYIQPINFHNPALHYHNGQPCYQSPCVWCSTL